MSISPLSPRALQELEKQIVAEYRAEAGDRKVKIYDSDPVFETVTDRLAGLVEQFPQTSDKKRFIGSRCVVTPKLLVGFNVFEKVFEAKVKGSLFVDEIGKDITFGPLEDPVLGAITTENIVLKVRNIRLIEDKELAANEYTEEMLLQQETEDRSCILVNEDVVIGYVDTNPKISKTQILADVEFGDFLHEKDLLVDVETQGDESTTYLIFKLPSLVGKISHLGTVHLESKLLTKDLSLEQLEELIQSAPELSIDHTFDADAPFFPLRL